MTSKSEEKHNKLDSMLGELSQFLHTLGERYNLDMVMAAKGQSEHELGIRISAFDRPGGMHYHAWCYHQAAEAYNLSRAWLYWPLETPDGELMELIGFDPKRPKRAFLMRHHTAQTVEYWSLEEVADHYL